MIEYIILAIIIFGAGIYVYWSLKKSLTEGECASCKGNCAKCSLNLQKGGDE